MNNSEKPMYLDYRRTNGGAREGAGRPFSAYMQTIIDEHIKWWMEKIVVKQHSHGQIRRIKKARLQVYLYELKTTAIRNNSVKHVRLYLDIVLGPKKTMYEILMGPNMHLKAWVRREIAMEMGLI